MPLVIVGLTILQFHKNFEKLTFLQARCVLPANFYNLLHLVGLMFRWGKVTGIWFLALSYDTPKTLVPFCLTPSFNFALSPSFFSSLMLEGHFCSLKFASPKILIMAAFSCLTSTMFFPNRNEIIYAQASQYFITSVGILSLHSPRSTVSVLHHYTPLSDCTRMVTKLGLMLTYLMGSNF